MKLELTRTYYPDGTNGMLFYEGKFQCFTIELTWLNNEPRHSCIPEGYYRLLTRYSLKFKLHFELEGVVNRTLILIHPANDALKELKGCIAPVMSLAAPGKGSQSRIALEKLKALIISNIDKAPVYLTIKSN